MRLLREPLLHFMLIGAGIFLLYGLFAEPLPDKDNKTVVVTAGEIEWMQANWQKRWNRPPTPEELDGLIQQYVKETILYREALTMGLNQHDPVVRRHLSRKVEFLAEDLVDLAIPSDEQLRAYFEQHRESYREPVRYTCSQVFFDPDKRGDETLEHAEAVKAILIAKGESGIDLAELGDGIMLQSDYRAVDRFEIQKQLGGGFADSLVELTPGQWHGPVLSGYGVHLVYVHSISEPPEPEFASVRERVMQEWKTDKGEELKNRFYADLRDKYSIVIEHPGTGAKVAAVDEASR